MSELTKVLTNLRSLRAALKELTLEHAETVLEKLQTLVEEKRAAEAELLKADAERRAKVEKYKELIEKEGFTADDFAALFNTSVKAKKPRKQREPRPAQYQYKDEQGNVKTWTGQGRTPRAIQAALAKGKSLSSFKIK